MTSMSKLSLLTLTCLVAAWPIPAHAEETPVAMPRPVPTKIRHIAVDAGFGGEESGPRGCGGEVIAKDVNLQIARKAAALLEKDLGVDVVLIRDRDVAMSLEERGARANREGAELLISIHTNGAVEHSASGVETYSISAAAAPQAIAAAARENGVEPERMNDLESVLTGLMADSKIHESERLATAVQAALVRRLGALYAPPTDRGVKKASFDLFVIAQMPAILVQVGFVTHPQECRKLADERYQEAAARGIVEGVSAYGQSLETVAADGAK